MRSQSSRSRLATSSCPPGDGGIQAGLGLRSELAVDQVGGLGDDQGGGDQRPGVAFQQRPAGGMVLVGTVSGGHKRAGVNDQHYWSRPNPSASISSASAASRAEVDEPTPANASVRRGWPGGGSWAASRSAATWSVLWPRRAASASSAAPSSPGRRTVPAMTPGQALTALARPLSHPPRILGALAGRGT